MRTRLGLSLVVAASLAVAACGGSPGAPESTAEAASAAQPTPKPNTAAILILDALGGVEGAEGGATLGTILGGPAGTTVGFFFGGVIGGVAASAAGARQAPPHDGTPGVDPSNPDNPFDEIGQRHNAGLDYAVGIWDDGGCTPHPFPFPFPFPWPPKPSPTFPWGDPFSTWMKPIVWNYAATINPDAAQLLEAPELEALYYQTRENLGPFVDVSQLSAVLDDAVARGLLTRAERARFQAWAEAIVDLPTEEVVEVTKRFEAEVQGAPDLTEAERGALLAGLSTGRHSAVYWADQAANPASPWLYCQQHAAQ